MISKRNLVFFLGLCIIFAGVFYFYTWNPVIQKGYFLQCPSYKLFGLYCAGCGSQRAIHFILHGEWAAAWHYNPLLLVLLPLIVVLCIQYIARHLFHQYWDIPLFRNNLFIYLLFSCIMLYMVARNLPYPMFNALKPT